MHGGQLVEPPAAVLGQPPLHPGGKGKGWEGVGWRPEGSPVVAPPPLLLQGVKTLMREAWSRRVLPLVDQTLSGGLVQIQDGRTGFPIEALISGYENTRNFRRFLLEG